MSERDATKINTGFALFTLTHVTSFVCMDRSEMENGHSININYNNKQLGRDKSAPAVSPANVGKKQNGGETLNWVTQCCFVEFGFFVTLLFSPFWEDVIYATFTIELYSTPGPSKLDGTQGHRRQGHRGAAKY